MYVRIVCVVSFLSIQHKTKLCSFRDLPRAFDFTDISTTFSFMTAIFTLIFIRLPFSAEQKDIAVKLYKQGIAELEKGIEVNVWQGEGEKWTKAQKLNEKMVVNLSMAKDRLHFLGELIFILSSTSKSMITRTNFLSYFQSLASLPHATPTTLPS